MRFQISMPFALLLMIVSVLSGKSFLNEDEVTWAKRLGIEQSYVSEIVQAAGFSEDDEIRIEELDLRHLRSRGHILLVTVAGDGHCLTLTVLARRGRSVSKVWENAEAPGGEGFCHEGAYSGNFRAHAAPNGSIVVDVPKYEKGGYVLPGVRQLVYKWDGRKYEVSQEITRSSAKQEH